MQAETKTVLVKNLSDQATEREIHEFFSFSGDIDQIDILSEPAQQKVAYVTFKDPKALEIALLLSGATIVDQIVSIAPVENYHPIVKVQEIVKVDESPSGSVAETNDVNVKVNTSNSSSGRIYVSKAQDAVSIMLAKGSAIKQDAMNKAKEFDEKHRLTATASAKVMSFDKRVGLTEKLTVGISVVNEKVKSVDQRFHVSVKTMAAVFAAERNIIDTGSAVKSSRYVTAGAAWLNDAFSRVARAGNIAGTQTSQKFRTSLSNLTVKDRPVVA